MLARETPSLNSGFSRWLIFNASTGAVYSICALQHELRERVLCRPGRGLTGGRGGLCVIAETPLAELAAMILWYPRRAGAAPSARQPRNRRRVAPPHHPLLCVAGVDVNVLPRNAPGISPQTDWPPRCHDRFPTDTRHHDALCGRIYGSLSGI